MVHHKKILQNERYRRYQSSLLTSVEILNENRPGLGILGRINVQNETNDVCLRFIHMHIKLRAISIQSESISTVWRQFHTHPSLGILLQFVQDLLYKTE
jgi:hypothetical protein